MKIRAFFIAFTVLFGGLFTEFTAFSMDKGKENKLDATGYIEVECNIAEVSLFLCPESNYTTEERKTFFGLIKTYRGICSGEEISIGKTPARPFSIPVGEYVLLIPQGYVWEKEGPVKIHITSGGETYFLLKLFSKGPGNGETDYGGGGGGGGGGAGSR